MDLKNSQEETIDTGIENSNWENKNVYKIRGERCVYVKDEEFHPENYQNDIEPWITTLFQSESLSLFLGAGISSATHFMANNSPVDYMKKIDFSVFKEQIEISTQKSARRCGRGKYPNIEDQIRVSNDLIKGLKIYSASDIRGSKKLKNDLHILKDELKRGLDSFASDILKCEKNIIHSEFSEIAAGYLMSFLISFSSRSATRERLNIFTTNYDRIIEYGSELAGIRLIDRFVGTINPIFRSSRIDVDMHYNPPGIRGEPRYLDGVVHFTKLHGSLDWIMRSGVVQRIALPYGTEDINYYRNPLDTLMIYPNAAKDRETAEYPYVELFRDFAAAVCRPNSTLVVFGYSFGDDHINRVIEDMLTIPSTHLIIISYSDKEGRTKLFYDKIKRPNQISLLLGKNFADLRNLVDYYLPKPSIDRTFIKMAELIKARNFSPENKGENGS